MDYFIGVDIGTSSTRAVMVNSDFELVALSSQEYPLLVLEEGAGEQDPEAVVSAVIEALRECTGRANVPAKSIKAISFASIMHSMVPVDRDGRHLTNAFTWADVRSAPQAAALKRQVDQRDVYNRTGCPIHTIYLTAKVAWLRETRPGIFEKARYICSLKDYVVSRLTGEFHSDPSVGAGSGLLNIHSLEWDRETLELIGLDIERLPRLVSPISPVEGLKPEYQARTSLPGDIPVFMGASDGTLANLGSGIIDPGQFTATIGSSAAVRTVSRAPKLDPAMWTWCYYLYDGVWVPGGATNNAGNVMKWIRENLDTGVDLAAREQNVDPYSLLSSYASEVSPGSDGLIFLAFLAGERCPRWNPGSKGVLFGLNLAHTNKHVVRAAMEGVVFQLYGVFEALRDLCGQPEEIRASGGFTKSKEWVQMAADVFRCPISVPKVVEATATGAAALGMLATGYIHDLTEIREHVPIKFIVEPRDNVNRIYMDVYQQYQRIYEALEPEFTR